MHRDLAAQHLPHLDEITLRAISTKDPAEAERLKEAARKSDQLTDELLESDLLVLATPMWNFGIPSALKAWIDLVVRPGRTFRYSDGGVLVWRRTRRLFWFWLRVAFLQKAHGAGGILSSLTCVKSWVSLASRCADCSSRGDEYSPVGCQRRAKGEQSCRGTCSVRTVPD
jgi:NAD(P)H-dependent FMN reductase